MSWAGLDVKYLGCEVLGFALFINQNTSFGIRFRNCVNAAPYVGGSVPESTADTNREELEREVHDL